MHQKKTRLVDRIFPEDGILGIQLGIKSAQLMMANPEIKTYDEAKNIVLPQMMNSKSESFAQ